MWGWYRKARERVARKSHMLCLTVIRFGGCSSLLQLTIRFRPIACGNPI
jgi:hypothetical protein